MYVYMWMREYTDVHAKQTCHQLISLTLEMSVCVVCIMHIYKPLLLKDECPWHVCMIECIMSLSEAKMTILLCEIVRTPVMMQARGNNLVSKTPCGKRSCAPKSFSRSSLKWEKRRAAIHRTPMCHKLTQCSRFLKLSSISYVPLRKLNKKNLSVNKHKHTSLGLRLKN